MDRRTTARLAWSVQADEDSPLPHRAVVGAGFLVGIAGNIVVRSPHGPGLSMPLFFVALSVAIGVLGHASRRVPGREAWSWITAGILLSSAFVVRASPGLQFIAFFGASAAFAFAALRGGAGWKQGSGVANLFEAVLGAVGYAGLGALRLAASARPTEPCTPVTVPTGERAFRSFGISAVLRGLLLATPLLFVFGALFVSADPVFENLVSRLLGTALDEWLSHALVTGILGWLAVGYLTGFLTGTGVRDIVEVRVGRPSLGIVEIGIALALVCVLFTAFIAVQFRYLFGGAELVEVTPGLTYAEYAREGFGQLALVSALVIPALLVADWFLGRSDFRSRAVFRTLGNLQLLLLALVMFSAFQRVRAYQEAYGLTEFRFYGVAFLGWLTLLGAWFGVTVLRGRRERFAFPAVWSAYAVAAVLLIANPDAWIAGTNLVRSGVSLAAPHPGTALVDTRESAIDADYLASLSADAVPTLLDALPTLPLSTRCRLAVRLLERWGTRQESDWRSWNLSTARARFRVQAEAAQLQRMARAGASCARAR